MMAHKYTKPAVLTAGKQTSTTGIGQDGNAAHVHDSTDPVTIAENGASRANRC